MSALDGKTPRQAGRSAVGSRQREAERMAWTLAPGRLAMMEEGVLARERRVSVGTLRMTSFALTNF